MEAAAATDLRYPIGRFKWAESNTEEDRQRYIGQIAAAPVQLREALQGLNEQQLDTPYREGGWTVRQVAHHMADSHMNAYVRFRLALTEETPVIKPYAEARWAELADARTAPVELSLRLLESLHERWVRLLGSFTLEDWARRFRHPELGDVNLDRNLAIYAWHGRHHVAHIASLRKREGW